jgi:hypothetical protein
MNRTHGLPVTMSPPRAALDLTGVTHRKVTDSLGRDRAGGGRMSSDQSGIRTVRVFLSSPSDVKLERQRVDRVAERLNLAFADLLQFKTVRWERRLYSSHAGFQEQIPEAAECDLVIAVFWSRLGTPLPDGFARMESGERYASGSGYEVLSALEARRKGDRPDVYVFRKTDPAADSSEEAKGQHKDLNAFLSRWFQTPDGQFLRAYHRFRTPDEFELLVERLLRHLGRRARASRSNAALADRDHGVTVSRLAAVRRQARSSPTLQDRGAQTPLLMGQMFRVLHRLDPRVGADVASEGTEISKPMKGYSRFSFGENLEKDRRVLTAEPITI